MIDDAKMYRAAHALYVAGRWDLSGQSGGDINDAEQAKLWEDLRDAMGLPEGYSTKLGVNEPKAVYRVRYHESYDEGGDFVEGYQTFDNRKDAEYVASKHTLYGCVIAEVVKITV